ncbi:uncharacterized protein TM35_001081080 [Trypanosoma theileri]|uniref:Mucin-associated surface protein (MASP) n=1 Tax=Trypanosoma theileri TaxID=67003 RepID=A0A1X0NEA7_9TRYP|nr:uncharacterized protein TM35_001081080 [Trypanosoma theileri]ORC81747.1 hypothetical protein TM35_001081080 [Trypanosoma theileri]
MMSLRHVFCLLTIALCCVCSCVVADDEAEALKAEEIPPVDPPPLGVVPPASSPCLHNSVAGPSEPQCSNDSLVVGHRNHEEEDSLKDHLVEVEEETASTGLGGGLKAGQAVQHSGPAKSVPAKVVPEKKTDLDVSLSHVNLENHQQGEKETKNSKNTLAREEAAENERQNGNNRDNEAEASIAQTTSVSLQGGRGINDNGSHIVSVDNGRDQGGGDKTKVEKTTEEKANAPGSEQAEEKRKSEKEAQSDSPTLSSTVNTDTHENRSQQEQIPSPEESQSHSDTTENHNTTTTNSETSTTPSNEESPSTTTTTTTTTLPPELTNNKKGDADSSSSISSSVWVRVPLLIVVTLACVLLC